MASTQSRPAESRQTGTGPRLSYWSVRTNRWTFTNSKIRAWAESFLSADDRMLNAYCGVCRLKHDGETVRNDIQEAITLEKGRTINGRKYAAGESVPTHADLHVPAEELHEHFPEGHYDVIVYDPPFSEHQSRETYGVDQQAATEQAIYETLDSLLAPGGLLLTFGFSSAVMPDEYGYAVEDVALWNLFGTQHDWVSVAQRKSATTTTPEETPESTASLLRACEEVRPNESVDGFDGVTGTTGGNGGKSLTLTYERYPAGTDLRAIAFERAGEMCSGKSFSLTAYPHQIAHDGPLVTNRVGSRPEDASRDDDEPASERYYAPQRVSDEYAHGLFETVVVAPGSEAYNQQIDYYGSRNVTASVLKYESHPLVEPGGRVIQVGHTATNMNSKLPYQRDAVTILAAADAPQDYIICADEKQPADEGSRWTITSVRERMSTANEADSDRCTICGSDLVAHGRCLQCGADVGTRYLCEECGVGSYHHHVWYVDCEVCGARPGNYCVSDSGEVMRRPHYDRLTRLDALHTDCGDDDHGVKEPPVPFVSDDTRTDAQATLSRFD